MAEVRIRRATSADAAELADVYRSAYRENRLLGFPMKAESVAADTVEEWIHDHRVYVAAVEAEIVGGVRLEETESNRAKLSRLAVREDWKGEGIGTELIAHAEERVREWNHDTVWLTTPEEHPSLPDFYRSRGYEKTGPYPLEYRDYDEIVMEKRIR
ncbi:GNAT family N-acetyltransferase [Halosolutus halophilus]|uniref:GNAT family N-acetyltransferase n=1 Tax=Halosolutus halophilus TaxID=1552990 RepID=UPI0022351C8D|nr:GNAT family N-acetyltransferase [Halosolutus halophilus]